MITKFKINNYKVLKNFEIDLLKENGAPYKTIIFVGENGTGKTSIFEAITDFINLKSPKPFDYLNYRINGLDFQVTNNINHPSGSIPGFHNRQNLKTGQIEFVTVNAHNSPDKLKTDIYDIRHYGCAYSRSKIEINDKEITSTTNLDIDKNVHNVQDKNSSFNSNIKQLLIDLGIKGSLKIVNGKTNGYIPKLDRFKKAFNSFFENLQFIGIDSSDDRYTVDFINKYTNENIDIDLLSTGEKQIVFRGAEILSNKNLLNNGYVFIDEPELGMHPLWQEKILNYYKSLITDQNSNEQMAQLFISTHSLNLLKNSLNDDDTIIFILENDNGAIKATKYDKSDVLNTLSLSEINYKAFHLYTNEFHNLLFTFYQDLMNADTIADVDKDILKESEYDKSKHEKIYQFKDKNGKIRPYSTLPVYIRNAFHHPDSNKTYTNEELRISTELLIQLCKKYKNNQSS